MSFLEKKRTKFLGLPIRFTTYALSEEKITITSGFLSITVDEAYMYKVHDVKLTRSFMERIFKLGTITCYTGDTTHPQLQLLHIKNSAAIKDFILEASEGARRKRIARRTKDIEAMAIE